jgi:hypothetical protein
MAFNGHHLKIQAVHIGMISLRGSGTRGIAHGLRAAKLARIVFPAKMV